MNNRIVFFKVFLLAAAAVVGLRLAYLQVLEGSHYRALAENNRLRVVPETGPRGLILDRSGQLLASNHTVFRIALVPQEVEDLEALFSRVSVLTKTPVDSLKREYRVHRSFPFVPATIVSQITKAMARAKHEHITEKNGKVDANKALRVFSTAYKLAKRTPDAFVVTDVVPPKVPPPVRIAAATLTPN